MTAPESEQVEVPPTNSAAPGPTASEAGPVAPTGRAGLLGRVGRGLAEPAVTLALAVAALAYGSTASYRQDYVVLICTYALLALGMYMPYIMSGGLSLAYNAYLGIGAYACGLFATHTGQSSLWGLPIAFFLSAVVATVLGLVTRKLSGFYLAGVTLLFAVAFQTWLTDTTSVTGGPNGIGILLPTVFGHEVGRDQIVIISIALVWIVGIFLSRLRRSPFGVAVRIKREVPAVVEASGVSTSIIVLVSLAVGAGIASMGGALFGMMNGVAQPESFGLPVIFLAIFMPLLGGQHTPWGAVLGAALVVIFTFQLQLFENSGTLLFAVAILLVLRLAPQGILGFVRDAYRWARSRVAGAQA